MIRKLLLGVIVTSFAGALYGIVEDNPEVTAGSAIWLIISGALFVATAPRGG